MGTIAEKLTYLNTTKEKIRDSINLTGANIGTSDTFRSYATNLKKGYIDIINNGIDTLYNNFPKVSGIGSNLSLTPTYEAPMKLNEIQGDTLQDGTPTPDTPVEIESVTGNQEIKVSGKNLCNNVALSNSNNDIFFYFDKDISQTFTLSATINSATSGNSIYLIINGTSKGKVGEITGSANTKQSVTITFTKEIYEQIQNSTTRYLQLYKNNAGFTLPTDAQIENGSSNTDYEEYKSNTYEVNLGKNLFDIESFVQNNSDYYTISNDKLTCIQLDGRSSEFTYFQKFTAGTYTISTENNCNIRVFREGSAIATINNAKELTFTIGADTNLHFKFFGNDLPLLIGNVQIEKGSQATSYSPYFTPIELNKIGTYKDRIYKDNGKWYVEKQIGKVVLDGSENWSYNDVNSVFLTSDLVEYLRSGFIPYSNYYQGQNITAYSQLNANHISFLQSTTQNRLLIKNLDYTGVTAFKTWLSTHNTEVLYVLNTPTYTEITNTELIEDLETLYTAKSQEGTTNISITSEDLEMILNVSALKGEV